MAILIAYDIPKTKHHLSVKVWRELNRINAKKISSSLWILEDNQNNLDAFKKIKEIINQNGGNARVMKVLEIE
jgi:hypothetical protein